LYFSNSKPIQGLTPTLFEDCGVELSLSDTLIKPINQENIDEKFEGLVCYKYFFINFHMKTSQLSVLLCDSLANMY